MFSIPILIDSNKVAPSYRNSLARTSPHRDRRAPRDPDHSVSLGLKLKIAEQDGWEEIGAVDRAGGCVFGQWKVLALRVVRGRSQLSTFMKAYREYPF